MNGKRHYLLLSDQSARVHLFSSRADRTKAQRRIFRTLIIRLSVRLARPDHDKLAAAATVGLNQNLRRIQIAFEQFGSAPAGQIVDRKRQRIRRLSNRLKRNKSYAVKRRCERYRIGKPCGQSRCLQSIWLSNALKWRCASQDNPTA